MEYSIYVRNWIRSLDTEIEYWKNLFILISKNNASLIDVNKSPFVLEKYLPKQKKLNFWMLVQVLFLDVEVTQKIMS